MITVKTSIDQIGESREASVSITFGIDETSTQNEAIAAYIYAQVSKITSEIGPEAFQEDVANELAQDVEGMVALVDRGVDIVKMLKIASGEYDAKN